MAKKKSIEKPEKVHEHAPESLVKQTSNIPAAVMSDLQQCTVQEQRQAVAAFMS